MLVISHKSSQDFINFLKQLDIDYILTRDNPNLDPRIADHPDLSIFVMDENNIIVDKNLYDYYKELLPADKNIIPGQSVGAKYPYDCIYNIYKGSDFYIHNDISENNIKSYMQRKGYRHLHVNQGYSRCSIVPLGDVMLTADYGIYKALKDQIRVVLLEEEVISLDGFERGFLGGCCGLIDNNRLVFNGDISILKSYELINSEADLQGIDLVYPPCSLLDTGSILQV